MTEKITIQTSPNGRCFSVNVRKNRKWDETHAQYSRITDALYASGRLPGTGQVATAAWNAFYKTITALKLTKRGRGNCKYEKTYYRLVQREQI
jgi:hypothetical protein